MKVPDDFYRAVLIPAAQALITGVLLFVAGVAACALMAWPWWWAAAGAGLVTLLAWLGFWGWWSRVILDILTPNRVIYSEPEPAAYEPAEPVRVIIEENSGRDVQIIDLPAQPEQLRLLASGLEEGQPLNLGAWAGPGRPFTRSQFEALRAELIKRRLIVPNSPGTPQRGYALTVAGQHLVKRLAAGKEGQNGR